MSVTVEVKIRPIGNARGVILPAQALDEERVHEGETVLVTVSKKRKFHLRDLQGIYKGTTPFERDHD